MPIKMFFCFQYTNIASNWLTSSYFGSPPTWPDLKLIFAVVKKGQMGSDCLDWNSCSVSCQLCDLALHLCFFIYNVRIMIRPFSYNWNEDSLKLYKCTVLKTMLGTLKSAFSWLNTHIMQWFLIFCIVKVE